MAILNYTPIRHRSRRATRRFRVRLNRAHRRAMQHDPTWRAELRAWGIENNLALLRGSNAIGCHASHSAPE
jgi:hypothetical protein